MTNAEVCEPHSFLLLTNRRRAAMTRWRSCSKSLLWSAPEALWNLVLLWLDRPKRFKSQGLIFAHQQAMMLQVHITNRFASPAPISPPFHHCQTASGRPRKEKHKLKSVPPWLPQVACAVGSCTFWKICFLQLAAFPTKCHCSRIEDSTSPSFLLKRVSWGRKTKYCLTSLKTNR